MAYGNKFVKVKEDKNGAPARHRCVTKNEDGVEYEFDPMMDMKHMTPKEVDAAIAYFLDLDERDQTQQRTYRSHQKKPAPNRFVHFQRR